ncbi:MAG: 3'-5' exonuclease [Oscillochloris sp.]|nr:3'-5' exonuclease [Oscillochloris sp.]
MWQFLRRPQPPEFVRTYSAGSWPPPDTPWREVPYVVLDVETSGLNARRDALLAIGLVEINAGRVCLDRTWYSLVRPPDGLLVAANSIRIHGLLRSELAEAPPITDVLPLLLERLRGRVLVVHVASIDIDFINKALRPYGGRLCGPIIDTARIALTMHYNARMIGEANHDETEPAIQLRTLATSYGLPVYGQHNALNDALTTAQLLLAQISRLEQRHPIDLKRLLRHGGI